MKARIALAAVALAASALAQMTPNQRMFEFQALASVYAKNYAPYEWKRDLYKFDMLDIKPWMERVRNAKDDLEFFEICTEYVASLRDTHTSYRIPSVFTASTGMHADIYDGKVIIDNIVRTTLPVAQYPFQIGDEIVSVDGKPALELVEYYRKFSYSGNEGSAKRLAAFRLVSRPQSVIPRAHEIGDSMELVVRRQSGAEETYTIPWVKFGVPMLKAGPVESPIRNSRTLGRVVPVEEQEAPDYMRPLLQLQQAYVEADDFNGVLNYGSVVQVWAWPASSNYVARGSNFFRVGTFQADGLRVGYIRIPNFSPASTSQALAELDTHIRFFNDNTDGLVVDVMRNTGGSLCYDEEIQRRLIPYNFRALGLEIRANLFWLSVFSSSLESAKAQGADTWVVALYEKLVEEMKLALTENRARTGPLPVCSPSLDRVPASVTYTKPLMLLADEFSTSAGDVLPAAIQDARRGPIFGMRTNGAGGNVVDIPVGIFSEATTRATLSLMNRREPVVADGFPTSPYVENVGVQPDIPYNFMTIENQRNAGRPFVEAFSRAIADHIRSSR